MGSKSKRRHAQKQYNRAQNKVSDAQIANNVIDETTATATSDTVTPIMTPKELRQAAKERAKQEKRLKKEQAKKTPTSKEKKEKKPFFLVRFCKWIWRNVVSIFSELKKVHWPTFKQVMKNTGIVLGIVVLFGIFLLGVWILFGLLHYLLVNGSLNGWTVL